MLYEFDTSVFFHVGVFEKNSKKITGQKKKMQEY